MKLAIFGSRTLFSDFAKHEIEKEINLLYDKIEYIITAAEPDGICKLAQEIAKEKCIPIKLYYADNKKYAAGKYEKRSEFVISECDLILFYHDGKSKGTLNEIKVAEKLKKESKYFVLPVVEGLFDWTINNVKTTINA